MHANFGQPEGATTFNPAFVVLQRLDPFATRQDIASTLQAILAAKTFIDGHDCKSPIFHVIKR
jgi:hypothetical protein